MTSPRSMSVDDATLIVASGVRRSCETAPSSAAPKPVDLLEQLGRGAPARAAAARSSARATWLANVRAASRSVRSSGQPCMARMPMGRPEAERASVRSSRGRPGAGADARRVGPIAGRVGDSLVGPSGSPALATTSRRPSTELEERHARRRRRRSGPCDDRVERARASAGRRAAARRPRRCWRTPSSPSGFDAGVVQEVDDARDEQHDDDVHRRARPSSGPARR